MALVPLVPIVELEAPSDLDDLKQELAQRVLNYLLEELDVAAVTHKLHQLDKAVITHKSLPSLNDAALSRENLERIVDAMRSASNIPLRPRQDMLLDDGAR